MKKFTRYFLLICLSVIYFAGCTKACKETESEKAESVAFGNIKDGQKVSSPLMLEFVVKGKTIRPALEDVDDKSSGHHHILIDHPLGYINEGEVIPADETHIHYGQGQESAEIELSPGVHTLSMQFADGAHRSYGKGMSKTITVTVVDDLDEDAGVDE